ncbi:uncharacterized protein [Choristoneura fumiferana]|uniref:uncharacterized protein n=1 Tax=Choristoneura fumiferana TaxID=7141 RepID=UPI003D1595CB
MDSVDLLARENEFKKLNKQLVKKTESLMKQIEHDMQKQDFFSEISQNISLNLPSHHKKHCCETPKASPKTTPTKIKNKPVKSAVKVPANSESETACKGTSCTHYARENSMDNRSSHKEFLYAFVTVNVQDKVLPPSFMKDGLSVESVCKFMASKLKLLQEQIDKQQATIEKKASQCERHLTYQADMESEKMALLNRCNNLAAEVATVKAKCAALQNRLTEKERVCEKQRSSLDRLSCRVKQLEASGASADARSAAYERTVDKLRTELEAAKTAEKEYRIASRDLTSSHQAAISRLESRTKALTLRIHKQAALIDNLKRQNILLLTEGAMKTLEKEYCQFLNKDF